MVAHMLIPPLNIGQLTLPFPVALSPMAGYTDAAMRGLCCEFGCGFSYTEVVNAAGLARGCRASWHLLETVPGEAPVGAHIYGNDAEVLAKAAAQIEQTGRFAFIDINAGCPVRKIVSKGSGAALMRNPAKLQQITAAVRTAIKLPLTVKTRIGFSPQDPGVDELVDAVERGGADALAIHGRYAIHHHSGAVNLPLIKQAKERARIPVLGNGGIKSAQDALQMLHATGVDGMLIGRGAIGNPWLFSALRAALYESRPPAPPDDAEKRAILMAHFERLYALKLIEGKFRRKARFDAEAGAARHFRGHLVRYLQGYPRWRQVLNRLPELASRNNLTELLDAVGLNVS